MKQLTLGQLLEKLKSIEPKGFYYGDDKKFFPSRIKFDFGTAIPTGEACSYRGDYSEIALEYRLWGHDTEKDWGYHKPIKLNEFTKKVESMIGEEYEGWKGNWFYMAEDTPVWVGNFGDATNTKLVDVVADGSKVILITEYQLEELD